MLTRVLRADLARNRLVATALTALIAVVTTLAAAATLITARTLHTIDHFFDTSRVPNVVQMHTGELDPDLVTQWATGREDIVDYQLQRTLPIPGRALWIAGVNHSDSVLEPAAVTSPERFDLLLGEDGQVVAPEPGQIALPVHYLAAGQAALGDEVIIQTGATQLHLRVSDFLRDAQMNPSLVTSKRMALHPQDYATLNEHYAPEYLIEFRLAEGASGSDVIDAYVAAGLPAKGIAVTDSIFWLMNGVSTFALAAIALIAAGLLTVVALIALRLAVLSALQQEIAPLAVLSAIGAPFVQVRRMFLAKYLAMAAVGAALGVLLAYPLSAWLGANITLYFGHAPSSVLILAAPFVVGALVVAVTVAFCLRLLRGLRRCSSAELLRMGAQGQAGSPKKGRGRRLLAGFGRQRRAGEEESGRLRVNGGGEAGAGEDSGGEAGASDEGAGADEAGAHGAGVHGAAERALSSRLMSSFMPPFVWMTVRVLRSATSVMLALVVMGAGMTAILPAALTHTMSDARFATYLGIGPADLRIDLRPSAEADASAGAADIMQRALATHEQIDAFGIYHSYSVEVSAAGADAESLVVEVGDHQLFPVAYIEGNAPAPREGAMPHTPAPDRERPDRVLAASDMPEIALSYSAARDLDVKVGDSLQLDDVGKMTPDGPAAADAVSANPAGPKTFTVSGIYQDLTNGGRSGKTYEALAGEALWQVAYATLTQPADEAQTQAVADDLAKQIPGAKVTDISGYIAQTMGALHAQLRIVTLVAVLSALGVIALITHLVTLLVCVRERRDIEVLARIGASPSGLRRSYQARMIAIGAAGTLGALAFTFTIGERLISLAFGLLGAPAVKLLPNVWVTAIAIPAAIILAMWLATRTALSHIPPLARSVVAPRTALVPRVVASDEQASQVRVANQAESAGPMHLASLRPRSAAAEAPSQHATPPATNAAPHPATPPTGGALANHDEPGGHHD